MFKEDSEDERLAVQHFDPWLKARGEPLERLAGDVFKEITSSKSAGGRRLRVDNQRRQRRCLDSVMTNIAAQHFGPNENQAVAVPLQKLTKRRTRYDYNGFDSAVLSSVVKELAELGYVEVLSGKWGGYRTRLKPSERLLERFSEFGVGLLDVGREAGGEVIILNAKSRGSTSLIDYPETPETRRMRAEMEEINRGLNAAEIRLDGNPTLPICLVRIFQAETPDAPREFNRHGRLYRGFWENLKKTQRNQISINGEQVADLDFSSMFLRLAYQRQNLAPPTGDLYAVPGLEGHRDAVKKLVASLFSRSKEAKRLPAGMSGELPEGWTMERFFTAFAEVHPGIAPLFARGLWFEFAAIESNLLVDILLRLLSRGIAALPMHDGLMVAKSHTETALAMMRGVSKEHLGIELPVEEKPVMAGL